MINISKISKMLLISGLVLAFSCVSFTTNLAYAAGGNGNGTNPELGNEEEGGYPPANNSPSSGGSSGAGGGNSEDSGEPCGAEKTASDNAFGAMEDNCGDVNSKECKNARIAFDKAKTAYDKCMKNENKEAEQEDRKDQRELGKAQRDLDKAQKAYDKCIEKKQRKPETDCSKEEGKLNEAKEKVKDLGGVYEGVTGESNLENPYTAPTLDNLENQNPQNYVSATELAKLDEEKNKAEEENKRAKEKTQALQSEKNAACRFPKSQACADATAAFEAAQAEEMKAAQKFKNAESAYNFAKEQQNATNKAYKELCGELPDTPGVDSNGECKKLGENTYENMDAATKASCMAIESSRRRQETQDAEKELRDLAYRKAVAAAEAAALETAYNSAKSQAEIACKQPRSKACKESNEILSAAKANKEAAERKVAEAETAFEAAQKNQECLFNAAEEAKEAAKRAAYDAAVAAANEKKKENAQERYDKECDTPEKKETDYCKALEKVKNGEKGVIRFDRDKDIELKGFNYSTSEDGDVFEIVTRRAAMILVGIKPIVYIFGAFGLVAFAWGAIFNKISWRHFSYIAIGLFLVANAGRLVEYAVTYDGSGYYIGQWQDGADTGNKDDSNRLAAALNDTYSTYTYKFVPECNGDDSDPEDCIKVKEYFSDYIKDEYVAKEFNFNVRADSSLAQAALAERGYCQRDIGAGFFNGIKNCVADVVGTIKTAANIVNTAIATVNHVNNRIQDINASVNHIRETFNNMEGGNFFDIMNGAGAILNDIESIGQDGRSIGGAVTGGVSTIVNNASNIGNTSQSGGILNDLQDGVGAIGGTGGNIANFADEGIDDIVDTGNGIADTVGLGGEDSGDGNSGGGSGGGSGDGNSGEDTPPTPAEEAEENYEETVEQMDQLNREIQQLQREIEQNQENLAQAQAAMEAACEEDPQSTMCEIYTDQVANYENMIKQATTGLGEKQSDLEVLEDQAEEQYEGMLTEQQKEAQERAETLSAQVTTDCEDPTSDACKQSMKELEKALAELEKINEELEELNKPDSNIPQQEMDEDDGSSNS